MKNLKKILFLLMVVFYSNDSNALICNYDTAYKVKVKAFEVDVYNGDFYVRVKKDGVIDKYLKIYNGNSYVYSEIMKSAQIANILNLDTDICYYNSGGVLYGIYIGY
ncbi:hypothetical protein K1Y38_24855 [Serratia marcescens]|uniref:hypothetical protein n=1 Tax=Serratia marcescens TaxID=615 RepID=UPI0022385556|nr:hypothetical protein [Serratia marcescens]MCW6015990.1 hypothetical protein [Serratia marcescens]MCW6023246.1 hypothetical protein [Serratia marcescens]